MAEQEITLRVWRGDAAGGAFEEHLIASEPGMVVLDALLSVQATRAPDLAVRWNCKAGRCGSCSAEVNGLPSLTCMTRIDAFAVCAPITVAPMAAFPVIKDLVTDVSANYEAMRRIPPFQPSTAPGVEPVFFQEDVDRIREFHNCIECFLCQDTCHVIRDHGSLDGEFAGPRHLARIASLAMHPLDAQDRVTQAERLAGLHYCNVTKCCSEICPEGIRITDNGIIPMKERAADRLDPLARLFGLSQGTD